MQKILDCTRASLAEAFASRANDARRQQYHYLTAIATLMAIVVASALRAARGCEATRLSAQPRGAICG
jgi:two-component system capsular synthesis sensor histidine kinase RcsC